MLFWWLKKVLFDPDFLGVSFSQDRVIVAFKRGPKKSYGKFDVLICDVLPEGFFHFDHIPDKHQCTVIDGVFDGNGRFGVLLSDGNSEWILWARR